MRNAILAQIDDKAPDVSTVAVKCLSQIVTQFAPEHVIFVVDKLGQLVADPKKGDSREVIADGLKSVLASISPENGKVCVNTCRLLPLLCVVLTLLLLNRRLFPG